MTDPIDVFADVGNQIPLGDVLVVHVVEEFHVGAVHRVDDSVAVVRGGEVETRVVDPRVHRFDEDRDAPVFGPPGDRSQRPDYGLPLGRRIEGILPVPGNDAEAVR